MKRSMTLLVVLSLLAGCEHGFTDVTPPPDEERDPIHNDRAGNGEEPTGLSLSSVVTTDDDAITDPANDAHPSVDIVSVTLTRIGNNVVFRMTLSGKPTIDTGCYKFLIDEDQNIDTGDTRETLGVDYFINCFHGNIEIEDQVRFRRLRQYILEYKVEGNVIEVRLDNTFLLSGNTFSWGAECFNKHGRDITDSFDTFYHKRDDYDVVFHTARSFDKRLTYLPLNNHLQIDVKVLKQGKDVAIRPGHLRSSSPLIHCGKKTIMSRGDHHNIKGPITDISFRPDDCDVFLSDRGFQLFIGDRFEGRNHNFIVPGDIRPSDFPEVSGNYPYTFRQVLAKQEVTKVVDILIDKQKDIAGVDPISLHGYKTLIAFDRRVCGTAAPEYLFKLGHGCIEREGTGSFMWWVLGHEMGHYFTLNSKSFVRITDVPENYYVESFASLLACWAFQEIVDDLDRYALADQTRTAILEQAYTFDHVIEPRRKRILHDLRKYEQKPEFSRMNVPVFFDIFVDVSREYPSTPRKFFRIFRTERENDPIFDSAGTVTKKHTFMVAAISAAAGADLRARFAKWGFPIDDRYFKYVYTGLQTMK